MQALCEPDTGICIQIELFNLDEAFIIMGCYSL